MYRYLERFPGCIYQEPDRHRLNEFKQTRPAVFLIQVFNKKGKHAHDKAGRQNPDDQCKYRQGNATSFITDKREGLGGRSAGKQLTESIVVHQFFFRKVFAPADKGFHHHAQMPLRAAKSRDAMKKNSLQEFCMSEKNHGTIYN